MSQRVFIDTNVFIYADDDAAGSKQERAREVLEKPVRTGTAVISTQVLQEYFNIATRKLKFTAERARWRVETFSRYSVVLIDAAMILGAIDLHRLHQISIWDAVVVKAASSTRCSVVLTEDMNHGQTIDGVRIENPFLPASRSAEPRVRYRAMPVLQTAPQPRRAARSRGTRGDKRSIAR